jgi:PAS domain S-box-containing protein
MAKTHSSTIEHDRSRERLYDIIAEDNDTLARKRERIIELGAEYLDVELGFVSDIDVATGRFEVLETTNEEMVPAGSVFDLGETYCRKCVESDSVLAVSDAKAEGWADDPAYDKHGLGCYLGTPIYVDGDMVGTLCFADDETRTPSFSPPERAFVELGARLLGREYELQEHERKLSARDQRLDQRARELKASEDKFASLIATAPDAIFVADAETGEIREANEAAAEMTGYDCSALVGMQIASFHPGDRTDRYWAEFERFLSTAEGTMGYFSDGSPLYIQHRDGTLVPVEISASSVELDGEEYVQGILRDVGDRRERERELRLKDRAIDEAPVGITIADATSGDDRVENGVVYANERFQEITGYDWEEIEGRNCRFLQGARTDQDGVDTLRSHIDANESVRTELLNYKRDGTPFWNEISVSPVEDERENISHFVGFQQDITQRKRQATLVSVLNRVLRHNLRNSMSVVLSRANLLEEQVDDDAKQHVHSIRERARGLVSLSERARDFTQTVRAETEAEAYDVVPLVTEVVEELDDEYPNTTFEVSTPASQSVKAKEALKEAIRELVMNAVKHSGPAPTVSVTVSDDTTENGVSVTVSDDGPGLPAVEQTVLERGYETPLAHSSGLGLWFVNWVVTGIGGRVDATVDDGTTVTLSLREPDSAD